MYNQKNVTIKTEIKKQGVYLQTQISQVASFPSSSADADIGIETLPATCSLSQISLTPPPPPIPYNEGLSLLSGSFSLRTSNFLPNVGRAH